MYAIFNHIKAALPTGMSEQINVKISTIELIFNSLLKAAVIEGFLYRRSYVNYDYGHQMSLSG